MIRTVFKRILDRLADVCRQFYGDRLVTLGVFGSVGRGVPTTNSDIDILLVADDLPSGRLARIEQFEEIENAMSKMLSGAREYGCATYLSPIIKSPDEVYQGSLLYLDMLDDLLILHDRKCFFKEFLDDFRSRLEKLKARKIVIGDFWYWDLKPDYRKGEIIDL